MSKIFFCKFCSFEIEYIWQSGKLIFSKSRNCPHNAILYQNFAQYCCHGHGLDQWVGHGVTHEAAYGFKYHIGHSVIRAYKHTRSILLHKDIYANYCFVVQPIQSLVICFVNQSCWLKFDAKMTPKHFCGGFCLGFFCIAF